MSSSLPLHIWASIGKEAWNAGHMAIQSGAFVFIQTAEDMAYSQLKEYARQQSREVLKQMAITYTLSSAQIKHLKRMYIHAFSNGALDQLIQDGETRASSS